MRSGSLPDSRGAATTVRALGTRARVAVTNVGSRQAVYTTATAVSSGSTGGRTGRTAAARRRPVPPASTAAMHRAYPVIARSRLSTAATSARMPA